jgi:hypothetical protein
MGVSRKNLGGLYGDTRISTRPASDQIFGNSRPPGAQYALLRMSRLRRQGGHLPPRRLRNGGCGNQPHLRIVGQSLKEMPKSVRAWKISPIESQSISSTVIPAAPLLRDTSRTIRCSLHCRGEASSSIYRRLFDSQIRLERRARYRQRIHRVHRRGPNRQPTYVGPEAKVSSGLSLLASASYGPIHRHAGCSGAKGPPARAGPRVQRARTPNTREYPRWVQRSPGSF